MARENIGTGSKELDEAEAKRLREREEKGLEPERHPGPRQNEGISSEGQLYATQEEADEASPSKGQHRDDVDANAAHVHHGEPPENER